MTNPTSICDQCQNTCKAPHPMNQCAIFKIKSMFNSTTRKRTAEEMSDRILSYAFIGRNDASKEIVLNALNQYGSQCRKEGYDDGVKKSPCHMAMLNAYEQGREEALEETAKLSERDGPTGQIIAKQIRSLKEKKG